MVNLESVDKYYNVILNNKEYSVYIQSLLVVVDSVTVFYNGSRITDTKEGKEVLEYFYDNLESE